MSRVVLLLIFPLVLCYYSTEASEMPLNNFIHEPDMDTNVSGLITSKGYPVEEHTVLTSDGYILSVQRIPYGKKNDSKDYDKKAVLLIHGLLGDATNWVLNFPNQSLAFVLADKGYDVWMLNTRGCMYSKKHLTYTTDQHQFWNFSFDQVGQFDVPATIDHILEATGKDKVYVIGHSQGTTATFAMLSEMPDYNKKVKLFIALAPVATVGYVPSFIRILAPIRNELAFLYHLISPGDFLPNNEISKVLREEMCGKIDPGACADLIFAIGGVDRQQLNETRLGVYAAHFPSGTSLKSALHYGQMIESKKFCKYDYGHRLNMQYYHQEEPPEYNPSLITAPVALFWSTNDKLADTEDVVLLRSKLKSLVLDYKIPYQYDHFDFVLALNAFKFINEPVLQLLAQP